MARSRKKAIFAPEAPLLKRRRPTSLPRKRIIVYCEGGTEEHYLKSLAAIVRGRLVEIEPIGHVGVPDTVVSKAIQRRLELKRASGRSTADSFDAQYSVWAVFDKDDHEVMVAFQRAEVNAVSVAYSNPCFELWGILHYCDHQAPDDRHTVQRRLRDLMDGYHHERAPYFNCKELTEERRLAACARAQELREARSEEGDAKGNPYTTVDRLIAEIMYSTVQSRKISDEAVELKGTIERIENSDAFKAGDSAAHRTVSELYRRLKALNSDS